jgi:hypothetical protein
MSCFSGFTLPSNATGQAVKSTLHTAAVNQSSCADSSTGKTNLFIAIEVVPLALLDLRFVRCARGYFARELNKSA